MAKMQRLRSFVSTRALWGKYLEQERLAGRLQEVGLQALVLMAGGSVRAPSHSRQTSRGRTGGCLVCPNYPSDERWIWAKRAGTPGWEGGRSCEYKCAKSLPDAKQVQFEMQALAKLELNDTSLLALQSVVAAAKGSGDSAAAEAAAQLAQIPAAARQHQEKAANQVTQAEQRRNELVGKLVEAMSEVLAAMLELDVLQQENCMRYQLAAGLAARAKSIFEACTKERISVKWVAKTLREIQAKVMRHERRRGEDGKDAAESGQGIKKARFMGDTNGARPRGPDRQLPATGQREQRMDSGRLDEASAGAEWRRQVSSLGKPMRSTGSVQVFCGSCSQCDDAAQAFVEAGQVNTIAHLADKIGRRVFRDQLGDATVAILMVQSGAFAPVSCHVDCSIGLAGVSATKMGDLLRLARSLGAPLAILGDFICASDGIASPRWRGAMEAHIVAPTSADSTCTSGRGRIIVYMQCSDSERPFIRRLDAVRQVPWGPHLGLRLCRAARSGGARARAPRLARKNEVPTIAAQVADGGQAGSAGLQPIFEQCQGEGLTDMGMTARQHHLSDASAETMPAAVGDEDWKQAAKATQDLPVEEAPTWISRSLAFRAGPGDAGAPGRRFGQCAVAAEKAPADAQAAEQEQSGLRKAIAKVIAKTCQDVLAAQNPAEDGGRDDCRALGCAEGEADTWATTVREVRGRAEARARGAWRGTIAASGHWAGQALQGSMGEENRCPSKPGGGFSEVTILAAGGGAEGDLELGADLRAGARGDMLVNIVNDCEERLAWPRRLCRARRRLLRKRDGALAGEERPICLLPAVVRTWVRRAKREVGQRREEKAAFWGAAVAGSSALQWLSVAPAAPLALVAAERRGPNPTGNGGRRNERQAGQEAREFGEASALAPHGDAAQTSGELTGPPGRIDIDNEVAPTSASKSRRTTFAQRVVIAPWLVGERRAKDVEARSQTSIAARRRCGGVARFSAYLPGRKIMRQCRDLARLTQMAERLDCPPVELHTRALMHAAPRAARASGARWPPAPKCARQRAPGTWPRLRVVDLQIRAQGHASIAGHQLAAGAEAMGQLPIKSVLLATHPAIRDAAGQAASSHGLALARAAVAEDLGRDAALGKRAGAASRGAAAERWLARAGDEGPLFLRAARWWRRAARLYRASARTKQLRERAATGMASRDWPLAANVTRQVGQWVKLRGASADFQDHLRAGWRAVVWHLAKATKRGRWQAATGPAAALQLALEPFGWGAREANLWADHLGERRQFSDR
ncbi:unnamed protein product [Prorocentrum cordatum]|uniref:Uncharacterized protein n=1 Tax=Prorocentrum cordatum TaxID=2364126 RepID=A0ABN9YI84_9DINO|nr:unnamed protein product [Polarella glacialis]